MTAVHALPGCSPLRPAVARVREQRPESPDTYTLVLEAPGGRFAFAPGQFSMLYAFGVGEAAISISGDPADTAAVRHTIRAVGSVTKALRQLKPGDALGLRGPFGSAWPLEAARGRDVVLVCGGIGLPPLRPALYEMLRRRGDFGRIVLLYGARTPADLLYRDELMAWATRGDLQVLVTVDQADAAWRGSVGLVTTLFARAHFDADRAVAFMCGPEVMMRFAQRELEQLGLAGDQVYVSLERNMQCAVGFCGHCQLGPSFVCMDGPVFRYDRIEKYFNIREA